MSIVAVERALVILRHLALEDELSVREIARRLGYSPAVAQKSMQALLEQGFAEQDATTQRYRLGPAALQVGLVGLSRLDVRNAARPHLEDLARRSGETALLAIRIGDAAVYIDQVPSPNEIRMTVPLGDRRPLNCTAVGKVFLSELDRDTLERLASSDAFAQPTGHSIVDVEALVHELDRIRACGVAMDREEFRLGASCAAAAVRDHLGAITGAITAAGPADRVLAHERDVVDAVKECASQVSSALGFHDGSLLIQRANSASPAWASVGAVS